MFSVAIVIILMILNSLGENLICLQQIKIKFLKINVFIFTSFLNQ